MEEIHTLVALTELSKLSSSTESPTCNNKIIVLAIIVFIVAPILQTFLTQPDCLSRAKRKADIAITILPACLAEYCEDVQYQDFISGVVDNVTQCDQPTLNQRPQTNVDSKEIGSGFPDKSGNTDIAKNLT